MNSIILVRHGVTNWNERGRYQGWSDTELNDEGLKQAHRIADHLDENKVEKIFCSDLKRAKQTAFTISSRMGIEISPRKELRELSFGRWEGQTYGQIQANNPRQWKDFHKNPVQFRPPGGETIEELDSRVETFWVEILTTETDSIIVTHAGPLKVLLLRALGTDLKNFWRLEVDLGSLSEIKSLNETQIVTKVNHTSHLDRRKN